MRKTVHFVFVIMLFYAGLTACLAPSGNLTPQAAETAQPQVTAALQATVTSTTTPEPALPAEVQEKFAKAGIDLKDLDIDQSGLHITVDEKTVDVPLVDLDKFTYQVNGVTGEIYQFQPVIDKETNNMVLYTFNTETKTWEILEVLEPVKISIDKNNPSSCTYMDVLSENLARSIREQSTIVFPADAINMGWDFSSGATGSTAPIFLVNGSKNAMQLANFCKIPADFLGLTGTIDIATVAVLNPDRSIGLINYTLGNSGLLHQIFFESISNGGFNTGILRKPQGDYSGGLESVPLLHKAQNLNIIINQIQIDDSIGDNANKFIFVPAKRR